MRWLSSLYKGFWPVTLALKGSSLSSNKVTEGKKSNVVNKIKQAAKPTITDDQLKKAKEYVAAGGSINAIETKYKLTNEQKANITKA